VTSKPARLACAVLLLTLVHASAAAQDPPARRAQTPPAPARGPGAERRASADEDFELNIVERRITEDNFAASTEVEVGGGGAGRGLSLRVGVAVGAQSIDVLLRNVRGSVRFRGTLEPLLRLLDARRTAPP
jgi:hypothetical protein